MKPIVTYRGPGGYSAAVSTRLICFNLDREAAIAAIEAQVEGLDDIGNLLDDPAPPDVWKATLLSAIAYETQSTRRAIDGIRRIRQEIAAAAKALAGVL